MAGWGGQHGAVPSGEAEPVSRTGWPDWIFYFITAGSYREDRVTHLFFSRQLLSVEPLEVTERKDFQ